MIKTQSETKTSKGNVLSYVGVFFLGVLVAANVFLGWMVFSLKGQIDRLKSDDLTLAQAINTLSNQLNAATGGKVTGPLIQSNDQSLPSDQSQTPSTDTEKK